MSTLFKFALNLKKVQQALIEIGLEFQTEKYEPPGIAVFMFDNATFVKCEKSFYYDTEKL